MDQELPALLSNGCTICGAAVVMTPSESSVSVVGVRPFSGNDLAHGSVGLIDQRRRCIHLNGGIGRTDDQREVHNGMLLGLQSDIVAHQRLEARSRGRDLVFPRRQKGRDILSCRIALGPGDRTSAGFLDCDDRPWNLGAGRIGDGSTDGSAKLLRMQGSGCAAKNSTQSDGARHAGNGSGLHKLPLYLLMSAYSRPESPRRAGPHLGVSTSSMLSESFYRRTEQVPACGMLLGSCRTHCHGKLLRLERPPVKSTVLLSDHMEEFHDQLAVALAPERRRAEGPALHTRTINLQLSSAVRWA
jgi:hypothetical protein